MTEAIEAMSTTFAALDASNAQVPPPIGIELAEQGIALLMPSLLRTTEQHAFGLKVITVMPRNSSRNLPRLFAFVLLLDAETGQTQAIVE